MSKILRIGTRDSQLAVWQAEEVQRHLLKNGFIAELVYIKTEGDIDVTTPLYEMGVQGVFTRSLDIALLNGRIDIAVHSMKDVPVQLAQGIAQAAVLKRASFKDILVYKNNTSFLDAASTNAVIATSSIRRKAQWLNRYPMHQMVELRGNVNTRLQKLTDNNWDGAIFAAAGLERINLRPSNSIDLDWMLPSPAQGAIMVVCRTADIYCLEACAFFNDADTSLCTKIERDFMHALLGGCSVPVSALAQIKNDALYLSGNILSVDGKEKAVIEINCPLNETEGFGLKAAMQLLNNGGQKIAGDIRNATK
jgi:hydroxymethylbilane synthase